MAQIKTWGIILLVVAALLLSFSIFTVNPRELAIKFQLGEIVRTKFDTGLHFKIPFINNVRKFDARIHTLESDPELYLTREKKNVAVDSYIKWRIEDVARYYTATGGDKDRAGLRLYQIVKDGLRSEFGKRTINEVVSGDRAQIMDIITSQANRQAENFGIAVVDVRLRRVDLPKEVSASVYQRMESERARDAKTIRSRGAEAAERIRADADRQRTISLAQAYGDAERVRGEGDALAARTYAEAYGNNPEFYSLYRSLNAYKDVFNDKGDMMVLQPDSEFFEYFNNPLSATVNPQMGITRPQPGVTNPSASVASPLTAPVSPATEAAQ